MRDKRGREQGIWRSKKDFLSQVSPLQWDQFQMDKLFSKHIYWPLTNLKIQKDLFSFI